MSINVVIWKDRSDEEGGVEYKMQISNIQKRTKRKLLEEVRGWRQFGEGTQKKGSRLVFLFRRKFNTIKEKLQWAAAFPYPVTEISMHGKKETQKILNKSKRKMGVHATA